MRERHPMPDDVHGRLVDSGLLPAYEDRPPYQRNDYIGWINMAKRPETRAKRIEQMLAELDAGGIYMGMDHPPSAK